MGFLTRSVRGEVTISRPPGEVWTFYRDFRNIPRVVGDVSEVRALGSERFRWTVDLPGGLHTAMTIQVEEAVPARLLRYRTAGAASGLAAAEWRLSFAPSQDGVGSKVTEVLSGPLGPPVNLLLAMLGKHPQDEVNANLRRLKSVLETSGPSETAT